MLTDADLSLIARDPALPGLRLALDSADVGYLRYKPGESCTALFQGRILRAVTAERYAIYRARSEWQRPDVAFLDDHCAVILAPHLDRDIRAAKHLLDPGRAPGMIARLTAPGDDLRVLKHKPGRRIVARIDRDGHPVALLKAVPRHRFAALLAAAERAWTHAGVPLLATDPERGIVVQGWIAGRMADPANTPVAEFARIGAALAGLHAGAGAGGRVCLPHAEALRALGHLLPERAAEAEALARGLTEGLSRRSGQAFCHGDFSADQVIVTPDGPRFIDWDRSGVGDPLGDVGSFLARLEMDRLQGLPDDRAKAIAQSFIDGYGAGDVALPHAAALAALVCEPFRARAPGWPAQAGALLEQAALLAGRDGAIARALNRREMARALGAPPGMAAPELLRERTGRRALIAYRGAGGEALGKLRVKGHDARTPALHRALLAAGFADVPEVLGELPEARLWLQARVEGRVLTDFLEPTAGPQPFHAAGRLLARFHGVDLSLPFPQWRMADEAGVLARALEQARAGRPDLAARISRLETRIGTWIGGLEPGRKALIHRDFYPDQVMIGARRAWLLDLDLCSRGDPGIDVANFCAHLREFALRRHGRAEALRTQEAAFLTGYAEVAALPEAERLAGLVSMSLARHLWIAQRVEGRGAVVEALLAECESRLSVGRGEGARRA